jgi:formylmethanofuran dehydrogenase subunit C
MPLVLMLRESPSIPIEVDAVRVEIVREQTSDQVRATLIQHGNRQEALGEFFNVSGSASHDQQILWAGDCSRVKRIGEKHSSGRMLIEGHAGMHLGAEMTGGEITVRGDVADWAGAEMRGGRLRIEGNANRCLGAGYRGATRGMTGGEILVTGSAGDETGTAMRRGLIAVAGSVGHAAGFGMIAGSLMFFGDVGRHCGAGMKRGTIALFSTAHRAELLPSFHYACTDRPAFLAVYLRHLTRLGFELSDGCLNANYDRYCGDLIELGKGEILVRRDD